MEKTRNGRPFRAEADIEEPSPHQPETRCRHHRLEPSSHPDRKIQEELAGLKEKADQLIEEVKKMMDRMRYVGADE